jgi:hypothetical protein
LATGIIAALAIAAPVAEASAATPLAISPPSTNTPSLSVEEPSLGWAAVAIGPTIIGSVFNGGTTVVISNASAVGSTIDSP